MLKAESRHAEGVETVSSSQEQLEVVREGVILVEVLGQVMGLSVL